MKTSLLRRPFQYKFYNAAFIIIGLNILVFLINNIAPQSLAYLVLSPAYVIRYNWYWQFFTYMFTHGSISHILFNMLGLFFFGNQVERRMGSHEFLLFYLSTGVLAGIFSFVIYRLTGQYNVFLLGASGAVYAVLLAFATYFPSSMIYVMGIIPMRAPILVLVFTAIAVFSQVFNYRSSVAHLTHLAGFAIAYLYFVTRIGINPIKVFFRDGRFR
ncbi:MAG: rhomboid family intramembrane serine protease [Spirochaetales bacterium]|nr:rhomboid family intramembrane serine protease [Spirochaetales bacterium]